MAMNIDQEHTVKTRPHGPMLVTGVKGSGKTSIGIKRAAFLLNNFCLDSEDQILFINSSKSFDGHNSHLLERIQQEKGKTLMDLLQSTKSNICISSIDEMVYQYYRKYCANNNLTYEIYDENSYYINILYEGIDSLRAKYPDVTYLDKRFQQFLLVEIEWIRACVAIVMSSNIRTLTE